MVKTNVLITGVGGGGVGEQIIKALRLCQDRYYLIGTDMTEYSMGLYEVNAKYVIPPAKNELYIPKLLDICKKEKVQVLIPGSEPELRVISAFRREFKDILLLINISLVIDVCMNKWSTYLDLKKYGFNAPASYLAERRSDHTVPYPVIIKPALGGGGSFNCYVAQNEAEMLYFTDYIMKQGIIPIVQQYLGTAEEEYTVGVLTDMNDGALLGSIALRRQIMSGLSNRMRIPKYDKSGLLVVSSGISQGEFGDYEDVRHECERIAIAFGSRGAMNLQCRKHEGKVYVFEINPRLSGTTYMRAMVGRNEPDILIRRQLYGERFELPDYKKGMVLRGLIERYIEC